MTSFRRGAEFPSEGFVRSALGRHFDELGYEKFDAESVDLARFHPQTGVRWIVEATGQTAAIGLDFRTGLGQLIQAMTDGAVCYGLAVPDIPQFHAQLARVSPWARRALGLHWFVVNASGDVTVHEPDGM